MEKEINNEVVHDILYQQPSILEFIIGNYILGIDQWLLDIFNELEFHLTTKNNELYKEVISKLKYDMPFICDLTCEVETKDHKMKYRFILTYQDRFDYKPNKLVFDFLTIDESLNYEIFYPSYDKEFKYNIDKFIRFLENDLMETLRFILISKILKVESLDKEMEEVEAYFNYIVESKFNLIERFVKHYVTENY